MKSVKIAGMTCQHCVMAVTKALGAVEGIKDVRVHLETGIATYDEVKPVDVSIIAAAIKKAGYDIVG
ncbi:MAG TPA: cation transporter [Smithellaceae bacterium]|jgi:copper chaperone|nr:cation transporter [Smithellaceae bacterium]HNY95619.1 cation transporter [Smithellaceae bacterium]HPB14350.1 cation transporter [Smithellaceae bacterium]HPO22479.1 cation transporter [Smithellaceae bacterium]HPV71119.1 cation transporter [Smithellaceae bacterium]